MRDRSGFGKRLVMTGGTVSALETAGEDLGNPVYMVRSIS